MRTVQKPVAPAEGETADSNVGSLRASHNLVFAFHEYWWRDIMSGIRT